MSLPESSKRIYDKIEALHALISWKYNSRRVDFKALEMLVVDGFIRRISSNCYHLTDAGLEYARLHPLPPLKVNTLEQVSDRNLVVFAWESGLKDVPKRVLVRLRRSGYLKTQSEVPQWTEAGLRILAAERARGIR